MSKINHIYRIKISQKFPKKIAFRKFRNQKAHFSRRKKEKRFFLEFWEERIFFISSYSACFHVLKAENAFLNAEIPNHTEKLGFNKKNRLVMMK